MGFECFEKSEFDLDLDRYIKKYIRPLGRNQRNILIFIKCDDVKIS